MVVLEGEENRPEMKKLAVNLPSSCVKKFICDKWQSYRRSCVLAQYVDKEVLKALDVGYYQFRKEMHVCAGTGNPARETGPRGQRKERP